MKYRKLRIAWSVGWGVACLLLIALWVRSYTHWDRPAGHFGPSHMFQFNSIRAQLFFVVEKNPTGYAHEWMWTTWPATSLSESEATGEFDFVGGFPQRRHVWQFTWAINVLKIGVVKTPTPNVTAPYWFLVAITASLAVVPWLRRQFSLRTLLIVMTVAAIGLGGIVYAIRK